jgi:hypothetical protein
VSLVVLMSMAGCAELEREAPPLCEGLEGLAELEKPWLCRDYAYTGTMCQGPNAPSTEAPLVVRASITDEERPLAACSFACNWIDSNCADGSDPRCSAAVTAQLTALCEQLGGHCVEQRPTPESSPTSMCVAR